MKNSIQTLSELINKSEKIAVLTGAGISTESGIPDFRSTGGFYANKMGREQILSLRYLQHHPKEFWKSYKEIFQIKLLNQFEPNFGHYFLSELEKKGKNVTVITQNVDGLHRKAGSSHVLEVHGQIDSAHCPKCHKSYDLSYINENEFPQCNQTIHKQNVCNSYLVVNSFKHSEKITCDDCGTIHQLTTDVKHIRCKGLKHSSTDCHHYLKPDVVLFGDAVKHYEEALSATKQADLFLCIGTSLSVYPVNDLPKYTRFGTKKVIINREATDYDSLFDLVIHGEIGDTLRQI